MSLAELIGRLSRPHFAAVTVSRKILIGATAMFMALAAWAAGTGWYFLFQDDIAAHLIARQSAMQQAYEEKIGALRVHLDRLASQNLVDQEGLDRRVSDLMARQAQLEARHSILGTLADRFPVGIGSGSMQEPNASALAPLPLVPTRGALGAERTKPTPLPESFDLRLRGSTPDEPNGSSQRSSAHDASTAPLRDRIASLQRSLAALEGTQMQALDSLLRAADTRASRLREALREVGLNPHALEGPGRKSAMGGPLIPLTTGPETGLFEKMVDRVQTSFEGVERLERTAAALPFRRPMPGDVDLTSAFGYRIDPFTRGPAMHTGLDFRAEHGTPVRASGRGQVVAAEYAGGYGNMIEIDHGNGVTTRYAHLSSITVSHGQMVAAGAIIGRAGSTGRSTGAHLHYETRVDGEAVDPQRFLRTGMKIAEANNRVPH